MLFGSCTVCLNIFRVGYDVSHGHCRSQVEVVFPIIEIIFMGVQVIGSPVPGPPVWPTHILPHLSRQNSSCSQSPTWPRA